MWPNDRDRRHRAASAGALILSFVSIGGLVLIMRWNDAAWMAEMKFKALAGGGIALAFLTLAISSQYLFKTKAPEPDFAPSFPEGRRLDTVVVAVAVRGAAGRAFLDRVESWRDMAPARQLEAVARALEEHRSAWASGAWLDDEPVAAVDAAARVDLPLDRIEAALPPPKGPAPSYRGGPDTSVVIVAFGGTSPEIANAGEGGLDGLLASLARVREWHHARLVCRGPIEAEAVDALPFPFRPV